MFRQALDPGLMQALKAVLDRYVNVRDLEPGDVFRDPFRWDGTVLEKPTYDYVETKWNFAYMDFDGKIRLWRSSVDVLEKMF